MRHGLRAMIGLVLTAVGQTVSGQDLHPGIIGEDDRVRVEEQGSEWDAIGHVNVGGYRRIGLCTGTLVAKDIVVTAAHCVMNPWTKAPFPLDNIHFLAGVRGPEHKGHAKAKCLKFPKSYQFVAPRKIRPTLPTQEVPIEAFLTDVVAIVLMDALRVAPAPLAEGVIPHPGLRLAHLAYSADHRLNLWAHFNCHLLRADRVGSLWFNDCDTHLAASGGPVFVAQGGTQKLAAIMVGSGERIANVALPISEWLDLVRDNKCA